MEEAPHIKEAPPVETSCGLCIDIDKRVVPKFELGGAVRRGHRRDSSLLTRDEGESIAAVADADEAMPSSWRRAHTVNVRAASTCTRAVSPTYAPGRRS